MLYNIIMMITCAPQLCYYTYINSAIYSYGELTECLSHTISKLKVKKIGPAPSLARGVATDQEKRTEYKREEGTERNGILKMANRVEMKQVLSVAILLLLGIHGLQYGQPLLVVAFPRRPQQTNCTRCDLSQPQIQHCRAQNIFNKHTRVSACTCT